MHGEKPREIALRVLRRPLGSNFIENLLEAALAETRLSPTDRHLCQELVYGVVRWQATLDWLMAQKTRNRTQKPLLQNILRLGLYQIFWLDRIPNHAAVHETVELAKKSGLHSQSRVVNAILRGYLREFDATKQRLIELRSTAPPLGYSHPEWLVARWIARWGQDQAAQLMAWNNTPPKTFARVNLLKIEPAKLLPQWRDENVEYDFVRRDWLEENLIFELKSHPPLGRLPSFQQGLFYVQDPSTLLAVRELDPQPGERILDLCAAPGGKLTYIAQLMRNEGRLVAHDIAPDRLTLIQQNCSRLGVTCAEPAASPTSPADDWRLVIGDSTSAPSSSRSLSPAPLFDRVLIDAPCSNTGAMRRRVDLRWRIRLEEIQRLRGAQIALLGKAASALKPGGTLVYSTCSLEPEENDSAVKEFLARHSGFRLDRERELLPFSDKVDGAYVARITTPFR